MPNQGNKSNGKSGVVQPKKNSTMPSKGKQGAAGTADKGSNAASGQKGDGATSNDKGK